MKNIKPLSEEKKYLNSHIYKSDNPKTKNDFINLEKSLFDKLKNPKEEEINNWIKDYSSYIKDHKELDSEMLIKYIKELFKKYDKSGIYYNKTEEYKKQIKEYIKENKSIKSIEQTNDTPLKILKIKKGKIDFTKQNVLKALALVGIVTTAGIPAALISVGIYKLFKKYAVSNPKLKEFIENNGLKLEQKENVFTDIVEQKTNLKKTNYLKTLLINYANKSDETINTKPLIPKEYKKNKMASMLLGIENNKKLKNNVNEEVLENSNVEMHKGLGKC